MRCFLDVHGLLSDLNAAVVKRWKLHNVNPKLGVWDFDDMYGREINLDLPSATWWANLPRTLEASEIVEMAVSYVGRENVYVATSAMGRPNVAAGTTAWVSAEFNFLKPRTIIIDEKWHLARSADDILIDDSNHQCKAWDDAGGTAIMIPRYWNKRHTERENALASVEHDMLAIMRREREQIHA